MLTTNPKLWERLQDIRKNIADACSRVNRDASEVRLIGVTKTVSPDAVAPLLEVGVANLGENRWQHARDMMLGERADEATWHFIGHLQSNKAKYVASHFHWCHSIDSIHLAKALNQASAMREQPLQCLVQVNVAGEDTKSGMKPEDVMDLLRVTQSLPNIQVRGLMTMAPKVEDAELARPVFRALHMLLNEARQQLSDSTLRELSMGMSDDYTVAVEEGATMIRIGRHLMASFEY